MKFLKSYSIQNILTKAYWIWTRFYSTVFMYLICFIKNIKMGKGTRFFGITTMYQVKFSKIKLGERLTFRSISDSNLIGINRRCILSTNLPDAKIVIGNNCGFSGTVIGSFREIIIGNNVRCGANTLITDSNWHLDDPRAGKPKPVHIHNNVWLGVNVVVLKGVTIGENSVIGANSVVTSDIPANCVAAGNPCRVLKKLELSNIEK